MKRAIVITIVAALIAAESYAAYIVVLKDGTRYVAKEKWAVVKGKAIVQLQNGQSIQLDPSLIDVARSEQATKMGLTNATVMDMDVDTQQQQAQQAPSLGSQIKLRKPPAASQSAAVAPTASKSAAGTMPKEPDVIDKFDRAFENVGIYDRKIIATGATSLRAELTVDTEDRVFNALSATSFLMARNAGVEGVNIQTVELFMKTTAGGAAGRFQMTRADAEALDKRTISQQDYFVRKVIY